MEYSTHALSRLSGVSPRTLRWYDRIGLLKPARVEESGYRYYGPTQVDRLQDILYYRTLGVPLDRIRDCLDRPGFDRLETLRQHLAGLREKQEEIGRLIRSVEKTIYCEERKIEMQDETKFAAFKKKLVEENETAYGQEAREKYGPQAVDQSNARLMGMSREEYEDWTALDRQLKEKLEETVAAGLSPDSQAGKAVYELHRRWLEQTVHPLTPQKHKGIAQLYLLDQRFTAYYDKTLTGCAAFLRDAVDRWAE